MNNKSFTDEIKQYSADDLRLILNTQQDLYSEKELKLIEQQLENRIEQDKKDEEILYNSTFLTKSPVLNVMALILLKTKSAVTVDTSLIKASIIKRNTICKMNQKQRQRKKRTENHIRSNMSLAF